MHNLCSGGIGLEMAFRRVQILDTISANLKFFSSKYLFTSATWFKLRTGTRAQRGLHLLDKMLVETESLIGRKERMWVRRDSGRLLIMSLLSSALVWAFCRTGDRQVSLLTLLLSALSALSILCLSLLSLASVSVLCRFMLEWVTKGFNFGMVSESRWVSTFYSQRDINIISYGHGGWKQTKAQNLLQPSL